VNAQSRQSEEGRLDDGRRSSIWRAPALSMRFAPIWTRNLLVWRKLALASVLGNIADPLITLVAFGYGLARLVPHIDGVPYIVFLAAGSSCMSAMNAASFEALYSSFSRMHVQRTWESLLNAPLELDDIVVAEWLWAATKSLFSGIAIIGVIVALGISRHWTLLALVPVIALTGLVFAALGLCVNALAKGYDFFTFYFTLFITPMVFLSGVFYPLNELPAWLSALARWLPLALAVDLARPLVLGHWADSAATDAAALLAFAGAATYVALVLTRRRFLA
jgi:lipooligosaccharide transport system permease protein